MLIHSLKPNKNHIVVSDVYDADGEPIQIVVILTKVEGHRGAASVGVCCPRSAKIRRIDANFDRNKF